MFNHLCRVTLLVGVAVMALSWDTALAQCEWEWPIGIDGPSKVRGLLPVEDGALPFEEGPVLYAGGYFLEVDGVPANFIAKWDGTSWSAVDDGLTGRVRAMAVFNGELYAGCKSGPGQLHNGYLAKWNGAEWSVVANTHADVKVMLVFDDDGSGPNPPALYIGGPIEQIDEVPVNGIAKWDGTSWSAVSGGVTLPGNGNQPPQPGLVRGMMLFDGMLLVGGQFTEAGGVGAHNVALWDGSNWLPMGDSPGVDEDETVQDFEVVEGELYASVCYDQPGNPAHVWYLAQWDPAPEPPGSWMQVIDIGQLDLDRMLAFDAGPSHGRSLHISGSFELPADEGVASNIARWNQASGVWASVAEGCCGSRVWALTVFDEDGDGPSPPSLYAGGAGIKKLSCVQCISDADCDDGDPCTDDTCHSAGGCLYGLAACGLQDGCCASNCEPSSDPDCAINAIPGDVDGNGVVDALDLAECLGSWGTYEACPPYAPCDLDKNCAVGAQDLAMLLGNWG